MMIQRKVHCLVRIALLSSLLILSTPSKAISATNKYKSILENQLEEALNKKDLKKVNHLFPLKQSNNINNKFNDFLYRYPNAKWVIKKGIPMNDGNPTINIFISGQRKDGEHNFYLKAKQTISYKFKEGRPVNPMIISEESILQSGNKPLSITLNIPDKVLTGSRYDLDIILNTPLEDSIIAGGLILISEEDRNNNLSPAIPLEPLSSGGLFKSIQAPLKTGKQRCAALIAHPDGLIAVTKMVSIVSEMF